MVCKNNWIFTGVNECEINLYPLGRIIVYQLSENFYAADVLNERVNINGNLEYAQSKAVAFAEESLADAMRSLEDI